MGREEQKVVPRYSPNLGREKASRVVGIGEILRTPTQGMGRPAYLDTIIEDSANQVPAFQIDEAGNPIGEVLDAGDPGVRPERDVAEPERENYNEDCTAGCNRRGTVHPLNKSLKDWQCSECGKYYTKQ